MLNDIIGCNEFNTGLIRKMTHDIGDELWRSQPTNVSNHPEWLIGHLTYARANVAAILGRPGPVLPDELRPRFGTGTQPRPADDSCEREDQLALFSAAQDHVAALLPTLTDEVLSAPTPAEPIRKMFPTVRDFVRVILTSHDALHIGQLSVWRKAHGLPSALG